jgi:hypothetical protein
VGHDLDRPAGLRRAHDHQWHRGRSGSTLTGAGGARASPCPPAADVKPPRSGAQTPAGDRRNLRVCGHAGRHHGPGGAHGGHVLPPHAWPQSMHAAREWVTMLALWSRGHLSGYGADTFQRPLVPRCRFQRWRTISVRVFGVVHVKDSVKTHRPMPSRRTASSSPFSGFLHHSPRRLCYHGVAEGHGGGAPGREEMAWTLWRSWSR